MQQKEKQKNKSALFIFESQPPHLGEIIGLFRILAENEYENIAIHVNRNTKVIPINKVTTIWELALLPIKPSYKIFVSGTNFLELTEVPKEFKEYDLYTNLPEIYTHFIGMNIPIGFTGQFLGYNPVYLQVAYRQSLSLNMLNKRMR